MAFPRYKTYCFYTTVKTGTIKLAIFFLFCGGCTIISSSVGLVNYTPINEDQINQAKVNSTVSYHVFLKVAFFQKVRFVFQISKSQKENIPKSYPELEIYLFLKFFVNSFPPTCFLFII